MTGRGLALLLVLLAPCAIAQYQDRSAEEPPALVFGAGAGYLLKNYPDAGFSYDRSGGVAFDVRVLWRIRHFFGISGGAGRAVIASERMPGETAAGRSTASMSLVTYPVFLGMHLRFQHFYLHAHFAVHFVNSSIEAFGERSSAAKVDMGYEIGGAYRLPIDGSFELNAGATLHYLSDLKALMLIPRIGVDAVIFR